MTTKMPPRVRHVGYKKCDDLAEIATEAAAALHMGKGERALLQYYAAQSSGFRPALQAIANATGLNRSQVWRNRAALEAHGLVSVEDDIVFVHWKRAKIYASLDPRLTSKRSYTAAAQKKERLRRVSLFEMKYAPLEALLPRLAALTKNEYADLCRRLRRNMRNDLCQRNQGERGPRL